MAGLPDSVRALAERTPVEDFLLDLLRAELPEVPVNSLIGPNQQFPFILVRRIPGVGESSGDPRFLDAATVSVQCFVPDPDGDEDSAILSEVVRVVLRDAWLKQKVVAGRGHMTAWEMTISPRRVTDWATATGPVQYADLPTGIIRYETQYHLIIRRPVRA